MPFISRLNQTPSRDYIPRLRPATSIPRIIHQTFPTKELPPALQANASAIRSLNPDYEWRLYDDLDIEAFIGSHCPREVLDLYLRINPRYGAARADLFRYLCIYFLGGVYLDIKSTTTKPLGSVLRADDAFILAQWDAASAGGRHASWGRNRSLAHVPGGEFQQWHVIAARGHPFLWAVINQVLSNIECYNPFLHGCGRPAVINTTGPVAYTSAIHPILSQHPFRRVNIETDMGILYSIFPEDSESSHHGLFENHYGMRIDSLVSVGALSSRLYLVMNQAHHALRSRLRGNRVARALKTLVSQR